MDVRQIGTEIPSGRVAHRAMRPIWFCGFRGQRSQPGTCPSGTTVPTETAPKASRAVNRSSRALLFWPPLRCGLFPKLYKFSLAG